MYFVNGTLVMTLFEEILRWTFSWTCKQNVFVAGCNAVLHVLKDCFIWAVLAVIIKMASWHEQMSPLPQNNVYH